MSLVKEHCSLCGPTCPECGHSTLIHGRDGRCKGSDNCLCGWARTMGPHARAVTVVRQRNKGAKIGRSTRQDLLSIPCYFCGGEANTIDHLVPRAKGGTNTRSNLVSACGLCNMIKSDKLYGDLIFFCERIQKEVCNERSLRRIQLFNLIQAQAVKILAWHEERMASKQLPVV